VAGAFGTPRPSGPGANTSLDSTRPSTPVTSRMLRVDYAAPALAPFAARYGCPADDGHALVRSLIDQAAAAQPGLWDRERAVADLARELLRLSDGQLRSLRSLASAAREPAIAALLARLATTRE